jgi:hypothetical protein
MIPQHFGMLKRMEQMITDMMELLMQLVGVHTERVQFQILTRQV